MLLILCDSFRKRDSITRAFHLEDTGETLQLDCGPLVSKYSHGTFFCVCNTYDKVVRAVELITRDVEFRAVVYYGESDITSHPACGGVTCNPSLPDLAQLMHQPLPNDADRAALQRNLGGRSRFMNLFRTQRLFAAPASPGLQLDRMLEQQEIERQNVLNYEIAVQQSLESHQDYRSTDGPLEIPSHWKIHLRDKHDPIKEGHEVCCVCKDARASICFLECRHQIMCTECVELTWSNPNAPKGCPVCRVEVKNIVKPFQ
jgi:hypothetical protein